MIFLQLRNLISYIPDKVFRDFHSRMLVRCNWKIPSLRITIRHHLASLVMPNSYPRDGIFNPHLLTVIKGSYGLVDHVADRDKDMLSYTGKTHSATVCLFDAFTSLTSFGTKLIMSLIFYATRGDVNVNVNLLLQI